MICDVCDYYSGDDYCWREPGIAKCPLARTCQHFKYQDLCEKAVELERAAERARCLAIVEKVCLNVKAAHRALAAAARGKRPPDLSDAHLDRLLDVSALAEEIAKRIRGEK